jgi:hypothetical protein
MRTAKVGDFALVKFRYSAIALALAALVVEGACDAAPQPMRINSAFVESVTSKVGAPKGSGPCAVQILGLSDSRRAPETLGVAGRRAIYAPDDRVAWLQSIFGALKARGINPVFEKSLTTASPLIQVSLSLQTIWVTGGTGGITATAVVKVQGKGPSDIAIDRYYRGNMLKTDYWSGGPSVVQASVDGAFSKVLDAMATDFLLLCRPSA